MARPYYCADVNLGWVASTHEEIAAWVAQGYLFAVVWT